MNQPRSHAHTKPAVSEAELSGACGTGALLRARREKAGLSIDEVAGRLRIKASFLAAIEKAHVSGLPQGPYAFGFVRSYASFLGLDPQKVLEDFKREAEGIAGKPALVFPEPPGVKRLPAPWIAGGCAMGALVLAIVWFSMSGMRKKDPVSFVPSPVVAVGAGNLDGMPPPASMIQPVSPEPESRPELSGAIGAPLSQDSLSLQTMPPSSPASVAAQVPELPEMDRGLMNGGDDAQDDAWEAPSGPSSSAPVPAVSATPSPAVYGEGASSSRVQVKAVADSWIQVSDGKGAVLFSRLLRAGEIYHVPSVAGVSMVTGNAGGIEISVDGRVRPPVGMSGQVVRDIPLGAPGNR